MKKALCIISGGMDSATSAYIAKSQGYEIYALHFDYDQRTMKKERQCFEQICDDLGVKRRKILDVSFIANIGGNALTDTNLQICKSGLSKEIPNTYVPFRNGIFLSIATALAEVWGCEALFIGVVEEDSSGYPDCSENFITSMQKALNLGTKSDFSVEIKTPLVHLSKMQIVQKALDLGVKLEHTWSCYENEDKACGHCDSCRLRLRGFEMAGLKDKIPYEIN
ncbi:MULTISPECIES: 7-cyano-7-deazaguanine synthase QueC [unclassified Campylobacter]|uniref:7-cyano-7-deazaguanine synthase QueC n=1 Tax=unclassified Campylobacter TaxID=2593542 RepID=UPI0022E9E8F9|nr:MULTISPECIES: 7-cyano-7-deazaguanine synthase QueC [unclassified Campylobacter]MDA3079759.1 7-cyano-7-deazaguanine synthase QueC [Campylobacter sp. CS_NA2]MDA3081481.1 7-cyano-7-deazaguanine synthase QueC [Campylobacter sp. CS_NA1]MDA3085856.1 7-cyano-7-deazaguanine synthase QueC [Campylobacter sp. CS_ED1]WBR50628.1 7-cyano-7-deazaguanine synthase QueC [Campylobacter sp. CS_NA3]